MHGNADRAIRHHSRDGPGASGPVRLLAEEDLYRITVPRAPRLSPDGQFILCLLERADKDADRLVRRLHVVARETGKAADFDAGDDVLFACWRPDGAIVAVVRSDGDGAFVRVAEKGSACRDVAVLPVVPSGIALSPDGRTLALTMTVPSVSSGPLYVEDAFWRLDGVGVLSAPEHLYELDLTTGALTQRTFGENRPSLLPRGLAWSGDGADIYFSANVRSEDAGLYRLNRTSGDVTPLIDRAGPDFDPRVSPCGEWIAWRGFDDRGRFHHATTLHVMRRDGSEQRLLADVGQDIGAHAWNGAGDGLWFSYVRAGRQHLGHVTLAGAVEEIATGLAPGEGLDAEPCISGNAEFDAGTEGAVVVLATPDDPGILAMVARDGDITTIARFNDHWLSAITLGHTQPISCISGDGTPVDGWLILPPQHDGRPVPLILNIHGGPDLAYGAQFSFRFQRYAAEGYAVLLPNYRGSLGTDLGFYEKPWQFPGAELDDLLASLDSALGEIEVDPSRLFVTGLSAGGALTAWTIGKTDRFAAAAVHSPVINWISHALTQDLCSSYTRRMFSTMPWEDISAWWARSPLSLAGNITTPALIIHGDADCRTPMSEGVQLYHALKLCGVPTALLLLPGAFHIPSRPSQWIEEQGFIMQWFNKHGGRNANRTQE
ncbi:S9 family peptidase [Sphingosinicella xenopeptidilytica]|uniref:Prolyl oligopeptidase family serine peptidase n=1 Tax=Sphingosinicella xenopeptidilytica TaxID=364098 RepID=A0ABW3C5Q5_SPHXN